jgi:hypothetical protein
MPDQTTFELSELKLNSYQVWVAHPHDGTAQDLTSVCTSIQWDYDLDQACEKYTVTFVKVRDLARLVKPLDHIYILGRKVDAVNGVGTDIEPIKFGIIIEGGIRSTSRGELTVTAYDIMWYLTANKSSHLIMTESASTFFKRICGYYGIPMGHVDETVEIIGPAPLFEQQLYEMFVTSLALTRDVAFQKRIQLTTTDPTTIPLQIRGPRFFLRTQIASVGIWLKTDPTYTWMFDLGNIFESESTWSASTYRNAVKVYRNGTLDVTADGFVNKMEYGANGDLADVGEYPAEKDYTTDPDIKNYGLMVESVSLVGASDPQLSTGDPYQGADYQAKELYVRLRRIVHGGSITSANINTIHAGDALLLNEPVTGMVGKYYVKSGMHKVTGKQSIMTLTLNIEDVLPEAYKTKTEKATPILGSALY